MSSSSLTTHPATERATSARSGLLRVVGRGLLDGAVFGTIVGAVAGGAIAFGGLTGPGDGVLRLLTTGVGLAVGSLEGGLFGAFGGVVCGLVLAALPASGHPRLLRGVAMVLGSVVSYVGLGMLDGIVPWTPAVHGVLAVVLGVAWGAVTATHIRTGDTPTVPSR